MAPWQFLGLCAVILGAVAGAQESTLAATTLANNPPSAFVYVPSTTIEGQVTVNFRCLVQCRMSFFRFYQQPLHDISSTTA